MREAEPSLQASAAVKAARVFIKLNKGEFFFST
jgi:hypothetical protein